MNRYETKTSQAAEQLLLMERQKWDTAMTIAITCMCFCLLNRTSFLFNIAVIKRISPYGLLAHHQTTHNTHLAWEDTSVLITNTIVQIIYGVLCVMNLKALLVGIPRKCMASLHRNSLTEERITARPSPDLQIQNTNNTLWRSLSCLKPEASLEN